MIPHPGCRNVASTSNATMEPVLYVVHADGQMLDQLQWTFSKTLWGKVKQILVLAFPTMYVAVLSKVSANYLHMRDKYRNRLDMTKTGQTPYDLSWPTCNLIWKSLHINTRRKVRISWNQLLFGNE